MIRGKSKYVCVVGVCALVVTLLSQTALGVGLLTSLDLEIYQGNNMLFSATNINTVGRLSDPDIGPVQTFNVGTTSNSFTNVSLTVWAHKLNASPIDEPDRHYEFKINGTSVASPGSSASLFNPLDDGEIEVRLSNMNFTGVSSSKWVEPFHPSDYGTGDLGTLPFFYMLDQRGFVNLPASIQYAPNLPWPQWLPNPSVQVPLKEWAIANGYDFAKLTTPGVSTGFELTSILDISGDGSTNPLDITPVLASPVNNSFFGAPITNPSNPLTGAHEIGISLNMRDVVPEPSTVALMLLGPLVLWRRHRRPSES